MTEQQTKELIKETLGSFGQGRLLEDVIALFRTLGYHSDKRIALSPNTAEKFIEIFAKGKPFNLKQALADEWQSVDLVMQLTGNEIISSSQTGLVFDANKKVDNSIIESYLFFAITLKSANYTRTHLSNITREVNRLFPMPVMILFRHGPTLTLAIIDRRLHKRDETKDVLKKVTLIKDIAFTNPHRAHIEILYDLSLGALHEKHGFTNFVELHEAWRKTLDSSELNRRFFQEVANWYFWAVQHVKFPKDAHPNEEIRNATSVIRLITRLIFCWFVKEKGIIPEDIFNQHKIRQWLIDSNSEHSTYYKAILQNLFFATLNQEMGQREFRRHGQNMMAHTMYRHKALFKNPGEVIKVFETIPFLNGGLFECLDRLEGSKEKPIYIRIDGFSDREDSQSTVPDFLFFSDEQTVDLNEDYGTSSKTYKVRGLLNIFDRYKFTINENTPIEEEIALDPELLGKVFENLLAAYNPETEATARKQTGSFYTPREIVNYMVDESLVAYFETKLSTRKVARANERLRHLFAYNNEPHMFSPSEVSFLIEAIDNIKILDPACGSGAFPMGILHKLVFILSKLDLGNERWKAKQIEKASEIPDVTVREKVIADIEQAFGKNELDYGRKLYLIENCIYGVDIQPIAVQIAKLRFFISLIVDQKVDPKAENLGVRPLPNLETKFVAANTLLSIERPGQQLLRNPEIDEKEADLRRVRENHFIARTPATKRKYREQDARLRTEIGTLLKADGFSRKTTERLANWNPYDQNASAEFFDSEWMFGLTRGFDVVIGNPPYLRIQNIGEQQAKTLKEHYDAAVGKFDIYVLFVENAFKLINREGVIYFIHPHRFLTADYGRGLKSFLDKVKGLKSAIFFGVEQIFDASTTYTGVFGYSYDNKFFEFKNAESRYFKDSTFTRRQYAGDGSHWTISTENQSSADLVQKLRKQPCKIPDIFAGVYQGIVTVGDDIFVFRGKIKGKLFVGYSSASDREIRIEAAAMKPLLKGENIRRYAEPASEIMIFYPHYADDKGKTHPYTESELRKEFPLAYAYIKQFKPELVKKKVKYKTNPAYWFSLHRSREMSLFENPKILTPQLQNYPNFTLDYRGWYPDAGGYSLVKKLERKEDYRFLLGIMNSKVLWYFIKNTSNPYNNSYYYFKTSYIEPFSLPQVDELHQAPVIKLVDQILAAKKRDSSVDTTALESEIDRLVYALYGLTPEEIAIVDGKSS
jgi:adenine-specific DNA-methyltransferase